MRLLFCADPLATRRPDDLYQAEANDCRKVGWEYDLLDFEELISAQDADVATRHVQPAPEPELALYRGWMMPPDAYARLYEALRTKNLHLLNTPEAYTHCHHLPPSYPIIEAVTPRTVWLPLDEGLGMERIMSALAPFGEQPLILKDYVKSCKHDWWGACYIPAANQPAEVERVVTRFLELQGDELQGGLVFREYVPFQPVGTHPRSGMPLTREYRFFVLDGVVRCTAPYWEGIEDEAPGPPATLFADITPRVQSRFFTMDVAQRPDGTWLIVELGDGQVAGLPDALLPETFYKALQAAQPPLSL